MFSQILNKCLRLISETQKSSSHITTVSTPEARFIHRLLNKIESYALKFKAEIRLYSHFVIALSISQTKLTLKLMSLR